MKRLILLSFFSITLQAINFTQTILTDVDNDASDNIYLAGGALTQGEYDWLSMSCASGGSLNTAWGTDGTAVIFNDFGSLTHDMINGLYVDPANGIFAVGPVSSTPAMVNFTTGGALNISFGTDGILQLPVGGSFSSLATDGNENYYAAGYAGVNSQPNVLVASVNSSGVLNQSFGTAGVATFMIGARSSARAIAYNPNNDELVVAGTTTTGVSTSTLLMQLLSDGTPDLSFGTSGVVTLFPSIGATSEIRSLGFSGTQIVAAGKQGNLGALMLFNPDGTLDLSFGSGGLVLDGVNVSSEFNRLIVTGSNQFVVIGTAGDTFIAQRYSSTGTLDTTFGNQGQFMGQLASINLGVIGTALESGEYCLAGTLGTAAVVCVIDENGVIDTTFGNNGYSFVTPCNSALSRSASFFEQEASGMAGGTFPAQAWTTRVLNQTVGDVTLGALNNNQFTLQPGRYTILAVAPAYRVGSHQIRLYNVTTGTVEATGSNAYSSTGADITMSVSQLYHTVMIFSPTTYEIQHWGEQEEDVDGFGVALGLAGNPEIYTQVQVATP